MPLECGKTVSVAVMQDKEKHVKVKGMLTAVLLIVVVLLLQTACLAADLDYSGPINSFTGEPADQSRPSVNEDRIPVVSGVYYDRTMRAYLYNLGGSLDAAVSSNVMDGMIVNEAVYIKSPKGMAVRLYCNGKIQEDADLSLIEAPGQYVLEARVLGEQYVRVMSFTIVGATTGLISSYRMPAGFVIKNVEMTVEGENGEKVDGKPVWDRSKVSMSKDGAYRVQYECTRNGMSYTLQTVIDHTPPKLALENVVNGLAKGPVDISDLEEGCKIGITLNGGKMSYREELTLSGDYEILLMDEAGNLTEYAFTILVYFDANSWVFFGVVLLSLAGIGIYLYMERKRMRVR
jgi:hypothetical protein